MYNILVKNNISRKGLDRFSEEYSFSDNINSPDAILVRSDSLHDRNLNAELLAIARAGSGVNNVPVTRCTEKGIVVFNTPGANANSVKELVIASIILTSRKIDKALDWLKTVNVSENEFKKVVEKGKSQFSGNEIKNKKLGVIGLGSIGKLVANNLVDLGMEVYGYDPYISVNSSLSLSGEVKLVKKMEDIYTSCDYITLHVPLNSETEKMINEEAIKIMKDEVYLLNFSRAELVDEDALRNFLKSKKIYSYITDFPTANIVNISGVISLPHIGASTKESEDNCAIMAVNQIMAYLENGNIKNSVNFNDVYMETSGKVRLCIIHENRPGMIKNITKLLSDHFINIENMQSRPKDSVVYTIMDLDSYLSNEILSLLQAIDGVIRLRTIKNNKS